MSDVPADRDGMEIPLPDHRKRRRIKGNQRMYAGHRQWMPESDRTWVFKTGLKLIYIMRADISQFGQSFLCHILLCPELLYSFFPIAFISSSIQIPP